jgi:hypothetical protein
MHRAANQQQSASDRRDQTGRDAGQKSCEDQRQNY